MVFNTNSNRYSHLRGLTQTEMETVMLLADVAIEQAKKEFRNGNEPVSGEAAPRPAEATQTVD